MPITHIYACGKPRRLREITVMCEIYLGIVDSLYNEESTNRIYAYTHVSSRAYSGITTCIQFLGKPVPFLCTNLLTVAALPRTKDITLLPQTSTLSGM